VLAPTIGASLISPTIGASDVPLNPAFTWTPLPQATEYELVLAKDAAFTQPVAGTPVKVSQPAWQVSEELDYGTTYFWRVRASAPQPGSWSTVGIFTTIAKPQEPPVTQPTPTTSAPPQIVIIEPPQTTPPPITITQNAIIDYPTSPIIWVVIGIGTVLVIGLIILIVATRRR